MKVVIKKLPKVEFKEVVVTESTLAQQIEAERISGGDKGSKLTCALLSLVATFDGKKLLMEDLLAMPNSFFLALIKGGLDLSEEDLKQEN